MENLLNTNQTKTLNELRDYEPGLKKDQGSSSDEIQLGNILNASLANFKAAHVSSGRILASAATTVVSDASGSKPGDIVLAIITKRNTGGTIAVTVEASVTDDDEVTLTPDVTPTNADGEVTLVVFTPVSI